MPIRSIVLGVADVARSVDFWTRFLDARPVGTPTADRAVLDVVTASLELVRVEHPVPSTWEPDDLQRGFRHIGFKVADVEPIVAALHEADVRFHLEPLDAEGEVRITFFFDPDGTLVELVAGPLRYHEVIDRAEVEADWALGEPERPRFDHVATTVADLASMRDRYAALGFTHFGSIHQPSDPRGYEIDYLRSGDTVLEVFTYAKAPTRGREAQVDAAGFVAARLDPAPDAESVAWTTPVGAAPDGTAVLADPDGLTIAIGAES